MIHDATGKFSSRCVLPDRNSLAVVISNWLLHLSGQVGPNAAILRAREGIDIPHIGEYVAKTNAVCECEASGPSPSAGPRAGSWPPLITARGSSTPGCRPRRSWHDFPSGTPG